jgi:hypothetical protein
LKGKISGRIRRKIYNRSEKEISMPYKFSIFCSKKLNLPRKEGLFFALIFCIPLFLFGTEKRDNFNTLSAAKSQNSSNVSLSSLSSGQPDVTSVNGVVKAIYEAITFPEGELPKMDRFRSLFTPNAQFIRLDPEGARIMDIESFISSFLERVRTGELKSFYEGEIFRKTNAYGRIAQVFSTYEKGMNTEDPKSFIRGINSIQLYYDGQRWWICSIVWEDERSDNPIPDEYLR